MVKSIFIALAACTILCVDVSGQIAASPTPVRVRVRGVDPYEMPGVIKVEAGRITSASVVTIDGNTVRMASDGTTEPLALVKAGARLVGMATHVHNGVMSIVVDGQSKAVGIPLDAIATLEVSRTRGKKHILRGILVGVGAFYGTGALIFFSQCGLDCGGDTFAVAVLAGITGGVLAGRRGGERWEVMPAGRIASQFGEP